MKLISITVLLITSLTLPAQQADLVPDILTFQRQLNEEFKSKDSSPLEGKSLRRFIGLPFFDIDTTYAVKALLTITDTTAFFNMKTTTGKISEARIYGYLHFTLKGNDLLLPVYQTKNLMSRAGFEDYLFFPFTDETNGSLTYAGGRYIDLRIPKGTDKILVDFNKAYNPSCAYNHKYSCPLVPPANHISIDVLAGVRFESE